MKGYAQHQHDAPPRMWKRGCAGKASQHARRRGRRRHLIIFNSTSLSLSHAHTLFYSLVDTKARIKASTNILLSNASRMKKLFGGASKKEAVTPWRESSGLNMDLANEERLRRPVSQQLSPKPTYPTTATASPAQYESTRSSGPAFAHIAYPSYGESYEVPLDRHAKAAQRHDAPSFGRSGAAETASSKSRGGGGYASDAVDASSADVSRTSGKSGATTDYANDSQHHQLATDGGGSVDLNSVRQALPPSSWNAPPHIQNTPASEAHASSAHSSPRLGRWKSLRRSVEGRQASYDEATVTSREAPPRPYAAAVSQDATPYPSYAAPEAFVQGYRLDAQAQSDTKPKRKLFGFGGIGGKDRKDKDATGGAAGAPMPDYTLDAGQAVATSDAASAKPHGSKEHSWYDVRGAKGSAAKSTDGVITSKIGKSTRLEGAKRTRRLTLLARRLVVRQQRRDVGLELSLGTCRQHFSLRGSGTRSCSRPAQGTQVWRVRAQKACRQGMGSPHAQRQRSLQDANRQQALPRGRRRARHKHKDAVQAQRVAHRCLRHAGLRGEQ